MNLVMNFADDDRGGRGGKASTSAWSKGKPPSLGGDHQKKVIESTEPVVSSTFSLTNVCTLVRAELEV